MSDPARSESLSDPLTLVARLSQEFAASLDVDATAEKALDLIARQVGAEGGSLFLIESEELVCHASVGPVQIKGMRLPAGTGIVGRSVRDNTCQLVRDVSLDPDFTGAVDQRSGYVTHSILCAPLSVQSDPIGAITLVNKTGGDARFEDRDRLLLRTLAASVALAILNARLTDRLVGEERVRRELELAAEIQRNLLPAPRPAPFPVSGANLPARVVSGDFYDFFELPDGRIAFAVGDVSGKGINAALLMAKTASLFRALGRRVPDPGRLLALLNQELCETATRGMFVTMVAGLFDPASGSVRLANAGHEPPLFHTASGEFRGVPAQAPPLGILPDATPDAALPEDVFSLDAGSLYVFTDGLTEARKEDGSELGAEGLRALLASRVELPAGQRVQEVFEQVRQLDTRDDLTLLVVDARASAERVRDAGEANRLEISFPSRPSELKRVREAVIERARSFGCGATCADELTLAIDEACQNVIRHAYGGDPDGELVLSMERRGKDLIVTLRDFASPIDPDRVRPRELDDLQPGGLGTHIMRTVMDAVEFRSPPSGPGNLLRMTKRIG